MPAYLSLRAVVLIAARDEGATIAAVVQAAGKRVPRVVVVADHCVDATAALARSSGAEVWERSTGKPGKARALREAWARLLQDGAWTHLVLMDGDGQHDPAEIPALLAAAAGGGLVVGSRAPFGPPMPWLRRWTNWAMSLLVSWRWRRRVPDSQCGFRVAPRRLVELGQWTAQRFEIESEMIREAIRLGMDVRPVPVACVYARGARCSHIQWLEDVPRWVRWMWKAERLKAEG